VLRQTNMTKQMQPRAVMSCCFYQRCFILLVGFVVHKVALGQVSLRVLRRLPCRYHSTNAPYAYLLNYHQFYITFTTAGIDEQTLKKLRNISSKLYLPDNNSLE
jgi:hypothetical protein